MMTENSVHPLRNLNREITQNQRLRSQKLSYIGYEQ